MSRPRVLVARHIPSVALSRLEEACDVEVHTGEGDLTQDQLIAGLRERQGLVSVLTTRVTGAVLAACAQGVIVTNTPDVLTEASADLAWALILGITRRVVEGDRLVRAGGWKG